jgi:hypothetical protein
MEMPFSAMAFGQHPYVREYGCTAAVDVELTALMSVD